MLAMDGNERICDRKKSEFLQAGVHLIGASAFCGGQIGSRARTEPFEMERNIVCWKVFSTIPCHGKEKERSSRMFDVCKENICCFR